MRSNSIRTPVVQAYDPGAGFDIDVTANQRVRNEVSVLTAQHVIAGADFSAANICVLIAIQRQGF